MSRIRDFVYSHDSTTIIQVLGEFNIEIPKKQGDIALTRFEMITPDAFMWRLSFNSAVYYLYAEDYIPDLDHVKNVYNLYLESTGWEFIKPKNINEGEIADFVISGFDKVFLVKSSEDSDDSLFSDHAPRGYSHI